MRQKRKSFNRLLFYFFYSDNKVEKSYTQLTFRKYKYVAFFVDKINNLLKIHLMKLIEKKWHDSLKD